MRRQLVPAIRMLLILTVISGVVYPLVVLGFAQGLFRAKADGALVTDNGTLVGSDLIGQTFTGDRYFHGRPSAAGVTARGSLDPGTGRPGDPNDLASAQSGASNLGPTNGDLLATVGERSAAYRAANGLAPDTPVPVDAVTSSGSGLDPHISIANARLQANRVAAARGLDVEVVNRLVDTYTEGRSLGFLGEPGVNVLRLNLGLDRAQQAGS